MKKPTSDISLEAITPKRLLSDSKFMKSLEIHDINMEYISLDIQQYHAIHEDLAKKIKAANAEQVWYDQLYWGIDRIADCDDD